MDVSCSVTLGQALALPQCPNVLLQRDVTAHGLMQLQGVEGQLWMRDGVRVPLGEKRCLHRALDLLLATVFPQGQQVSVRGGTAVRRPCPQAVPPTQARVLQSPWWRVTRVSIHVPAPLPPAQPWGCQCQQ